MPAQQLITSTLSVLSDAFSSPLLSNPPGLIGKLLIQCGGEVMIFLSFQCVVARTYHTCQILKAFQKCTKEGNTQSPDSQLTRLSSHPRGFCCCK